MRRIGKWMLPAAMLAMTWSCSPTQGRQQDDGPIAADDGRMCVGDKPRGVYYWKTVLSLNDRERELVEQHGIARMYVRFFDVDEREEYDGSIAPVPVATTKFETAVPQGVEVVPVVFITNETMRTASHFAPQMYARIQAMARGNKLGEIKEIQLDCDWTETTRPQFFDLCRQVCQLAHKDSITVSATIRLHQLATAAPPVDRGVLMLYNTGNMRSRKTQNSILHQEDVAAYVKHGIDYALPLALAFPTYEWGLVFNSYGFSRIVRHAEVENKEKFDALGKGRYVACSDQKIEDCWIRRRDTIRWETSDMKEIDAVKDMVLKGMKSKVDGMVIYHLDAANWAKYNDKEIERILE